MTSDVFYKSINDFCRKYFVVGQRPLTPLELQSFSTIEASERAALFEHLLLFDTVSIKVYGENIPLAVLLRLWVREGWRS
jgi:hypothetical protein